MVDVSVSMTTVPERNVKLALAAVERAAAFSSIGLWSRKKMYCIPLSKLAVL